MILPYSLPFDILHDYSSERWGISVPLRLVVGDRWARLRAAIDTGASCCIFERGFGEELGLTIETGFPQNIATATGFFRAYGHEVTLEAFGLSFDSMVFFAEPTGFSRNVLGRQGWLDRVRLALVHHDSHLYLSPYAR